MEIKFKRDTAFRKQFFVPDSFAHPAKMDAQLLIWIVERYTQVGETILDPMAGSGTTILACGLGRNCILVELEEKFCKMMRDNWGEVRMRPQLGSSMGDCQIMRGDARQLEGLVDKCIFSPPYSNEHPSGLSDKTIRNLEQSQGRKYTRRSFTGGEEYGNSKENISNLPYGQIDKIVTSPPFQEPEIRRSGQDKSREGYNYGSKLKMSSEHPDNISRVAENEYATTYLEAMLQVYQQCHKVLKPDGGLLILVTKNFIRNKQVVRLDEDTIKLCEQAGFTYLERHYRKLTAQSFWRTIYHQKHPEVEKLTHEDVLVFRK